jgi:hypothetical protein
MRTATAECAHAEIEVARNVSLIHHKENPASRTGLALENLGANYKPNDFRQNAPVKSRKRRSGVCSEQEALDLIWALYFGADLLGWSDEIGAERGRVKVQAIVVTGSVLFGMPPA